jgi:ribonuclease BN (tRNA processing enzyme)
MKIKILGAHNIESKDTRYACLLLDDVLAIDAAALTARLSLKAQGRLKAVLLTHRHYDHVKDLPALGMNFYLLGKSVDIYALQNVFADLAAHYDDEFLYPDFTKKPPQKPAFQFKVVEPGREETVAGYKVLPVPVNHAVPCVGYQITSTAGKKLFYTSDTGPGLNKCWRQVTPDMLIVEVTAPDRDRDFALKTGHLTPALLRAELEAFRRIKGYLPQVVALHTNPLLSADIAAELASVSAALDTKILPGREGMHFEL